VTTTQAIAHAMAHGLERRDAQLLVLFALGRLLPGGTGAARAWLLSHDSDTLDAGSQSRFDAALQRRRSGEPFAYITGHQEFFGLDFEVDARVLVPRPDTETLVEWALDLLPKDSRSKVIDLGTGSGAIALALKYHRPKAQIKALDFSEEALQVAKNNANRLGLNVDFLQGRWLTAVHDVFDVIVSNPPYIANQDAHLENLRHEPLQALASGTDGLDDLRTITLQARTAITHGGWLLLEHGYDQASAVRALLSNAGFSSVQSRRDLAGIERCSAGQWFNPRPSDSRH
jgi:release factor glutamine methyltransferase